MDFFPIEPCPFSFLRGKDLFSCGIIDHPQDNLSSFRKGDRDTVNRKTVRIIGVAGRGVEDLAASFSVVILFSFLRPLKRNPMRYTLSIVYFRIVISRGFTIPGGYIEIGRRHGPL